MTQQRHCSSVSPSSCRTGSSTCSNLHSSSSLWLLRVAAPFYHHSTTTAAAVPAAAPTAHKACQVPTTKEGTPTDGDVLLQQEEKQMAVLLLSST